MNNCKYFPSLKKNDKKVLIQTFSHFNIEKIRFELSVENEMNLKKSRCEKKTFNKKLEKLLN